MCAMILIIIRNIRVQNHTVRVIHNLTPVNTKSHRYTVSGDHVRSDDLSSVPRSVERRSEKIGRQHGAIPPVTFLHARLRSADSQG